MRLKKSFRQLKKISFWLAVIISINLLSQTAAAYFYDFEKAVSFGFQISTLDFSLFSPTDNFVPKSKANALEPGDRLERMVKIKQKGNSSFSYNIFSQKISGSQEFCQALQLEAKLKGNIVFLGQLLDFSTIAFLNNPPGIDTWQFKLLLPENPDSSLAGKFCNFKFIFRADQGGFFDQEEIISEIQSAQEFEETEFFERTRIQTILFRSH